jgi:putative oxidoreductase
MTEVLPPRTAPARRIPPLARSAHQAEERVIAVLQRISLPCLRISLGLTFTWFGALKAAGVSPVGSLVAHTMPFLDPHWFVPALGVFEVVLGIALMTARSLRIVVPVLAAHLAGTFLVLVTQPELAFQHGNPLLLSTIGEFVIKNVVLIAAAMVLGSRIPSRTGSASARR